MADVHEGSLNDDLTGLDGFNGGQIFLLKGKDIPRTAQQVSPTSNPIRRITSTFDLPENIFLTKEKNRKENKSGNATDEGLRIKRKLQKRKYKKWGVVVGFNSMGKVDSDVVENWDKRTNMAIWDKYAIYVNLMFQNKQFLYTIPGQDRQEIQQCEHLRPYSQTSTGQACRVWENSD